MSQKKPLYAFYENLVADNYDLPDYSSFERTLTASGKKGYENRTKFYNMLKGDGYDVPDDYDTFRDTLFKPRKSKAAGGKKTAADYGAQIQGTQAAIDAEKKRRQDFAAGGSGVAERVAGSLWGGLKEVGQSAWESVTGQDSGKRRAQEYADKRKQLAEYDKRVQDLETRKAALEYDRQAAETQAAIDTPKRRGAGMTAAERGAMIESVSDIKADASASDALTRDLLNTRTRQAQRPLNVKPARVGGHSKTEKGALAYYDQNGGAHKTRTEADWANADIDAETSLTEKIAETERELSELKSGGKRIGVLQGTPLGGGASEETKKKRLATNLNAAAERQTEERLQVLKDEQARRAGEDKGFLGGAAQAAKDSRTWDMGYQDLRDGLAALSAMDAGNLTPEEKKARDRYMEAAGRLLEERARYGENGSWRERAGEMGVQMLPFMAQFWATGGGSAVTKGAGAAAKEAAKRLLGKKLAGKVAAKAAGNAAVKAAAKAVTANNAAAKGAAAKIAEQGLEGYFKEEGAKQAAKGLARWTADKGLRSAATAGGDLAKAAGMSNTIQAMQTGADIIGRKTGQVKRNAAGEYEYEGGKSWGDAAWQGEANSIIENFSEMFGTHLDPLIGTKNAAKVAKVFGAGRISRMLGGEGAKKALQASDGVSRLLKKAGVSDYFGETAEEYYGQALRTLLDLDDAYTEDENGERVNNFKDAKFHTDIIGGMALTMLVPAALKGAAGGAAYLSAKRQLGIEDRNARTLLGDEVWRGLRDEFRKAEGDGISDFLAGVETRTDLDTAQKRAVKAYAYTSLSLRGYDLAGVNKAAADLDEETAAGVNKATGKTRTATMPTADGGEKTVQVVGGNVTAREDGTVDRSKSDKTVVVRDPETGEEKFIDAHRLRNVTAEEAPMPRYGRGDRVTLQGDNGETLSGVVETTADGAVIVRLDEPLNGVFYQAMPEEEFKERARSIEIHDPVSEEEGGEWREVWRREDPTPAPLPKEGEEYSRLDDGTESVTSETSEISEETARESETEEPQDGAETDTAAEGETGSEREAEETESGEEPRAVSALARIPKDERTGEPKWESADAATAREGLIEQCEGDTDLAARVMSAQAAQAEAAVKRLRKSAPKPKKVQAQGTVSQMIAAEKAARTAYESETLEYRAQLEAAEKTAAFWQSVHALEQESRRMANRGRREREITAERERRERSKAAAFAAGDAVTEKWNAAPKIAGAEHEVILADGTSLPGRYVLTEAGAASASHDANRGFAQTEGFPHDENGETVNDRDYRGDRQAQEAVRRMAANYDGRAAQSPVVVSAEGVVLSGNNRTMSGDLAAAGGTDGAYVEYLTRNAGRYGFTAEQVAGMAHPRVVFVTEAALPYTAATFAAFNAETQKTMSKPEQAVKLGKTIPEDAFRRIVTMINRYDSLSEFYADEQAAADALAELLDAGVINDLQLPELRTGFSLSAQGRELLENSLIGKAFQNSPDAVRQLVADGAMRQSVVMALGEIARNRALAGGYDLADELAAAVDLVSRAKAEDPKGYGRGNSVARFAMQAGLFDEELGDSRVTDACTVLLADTLNGSKPSGLRKVLSVYNNEASAPAGGEMDMFAGRVRSKEETLTEVINHFRNANGKEQDAIEREAVRERKRIQREEDERGGTEQVAAAAEGRESGGVDPAPAGNEEGRVKSEELETETEPQAETAEGLPEEERELTARESEEEETAEEKVLPKLRRLLASMRDKAAKYHDYEDFCAAVAEDPELRAAALALDAEDAASAEDFARRAWARYDQVRSKTDALGGVEEKWADAIDDYVEERYGLSRKRGAERSAALAEMRADETLARMREERDAEYAAVERLPLEAFREGRIADARGNALNADGALMTESESGAPETEKGKAEEKAEEAKEEGAEAWDNLTEEEKKRLKREGIDAELYGFLKAVDMENVKWPKDVPEEEVVAFKQKGGKRSDSVNVKTCFVGDDLYVDFGRGKYLFHTADGGAKLASRPNCVVIRGARRHYVGDIVFRLEYAGVRLHQARAAQDCVRKLFHRDAIKDPFRRRMSLLNGLKLQKREDALRPLTEEEVAMRGAVTDALRRAGVEVIEDEEAGQRVLDFLKGGLAADEEARLHKVFHGSGADFDRFDHSHMGEGEGAQAYGWGTYVTEVEGIGKSYAKSNSGGITRESAYMRYNLHEAENKEDVLSGKLRDIGDYDEYAQRKWSEINICKWFYEDAKKSGDEKAAEYYSQQVKLLTEDLTPDGHERAKGELRKQIAEKKEEIERLKAAIKEAEKGTPILYTVEIPDDNGNNYLDWTAEVSAELEEEVMRRLEERGFDVRTSTDLGYTKVYAEKDGVRLDFVRGEGNTCADFYNDLYNGLGERAASELLAECGFVGIKYPAEYRSGGREDKAKNYVIFNENDLEITDKVRLFRTKDGEAYGFTVGGKIYLDPRRATAETPVHEFAHLWAAALREGNPEEWRNVVELMRGTSVWEETRRLYPELTDENDLADEVLAQYSGRRGAERLRAETERILNGGGSVSAKAAAVAALQDIRRALRKFWKNVADMLHIHYTTAEEVADKVLADIFNPSRGRGKSYAPRFDGGNADIRYQFIGEKGAIALDKAQRSLERVENLETAEEMEAAGKDAKAVKLATGWERGADGKWRYEVPDIDFSRPHTLNLWLDGQPWGKRYKELEEAWIMGEATPEEAAFVESHAGEVSAKSAEIEKRENKTLADYVDAPELFAAYPDMKGIKILFTDETPNGDYDRDGWYGRGENGMNEYVGINISPYSEEWRGILVHELQHAVQEREGFAKGGSMSGTADLFARAKREKAARGYAQGMRETREEMKERGDEDYHNANRVEEEYLAVLREFAKYPEWADIIPDADTRSQGFNYFARGYADKRLDDAIKIFRLDQTPRADFDPYTEYTRLAGEVEARNAARRMRMSAEERRNSLASETEDVPREKQPVRFRDGGDFAEAVEKPAGSVTDKAAMAKRAAELSERLGVPAVVVSSEEEVAAWPDARKRRAKGWFDPRTGRVVIVAANHEDMADVENTVLHEAVGHGGLRLLFPTEGERNAMLDKLYSSSSAEIDRRAETLQTSLKGRLTPAERLRLRRLATEEYGAEVCGRLGFEGFDALTAAEESFFGRLRELLERALKGLARRLGLRGGEWTDKEWAYVYREAYKRLRNGGGASALDLADTVAARRAFGVDAGLRSDATEVLFREGDAADYRKAHAREMYERRVRSGAYQAREALQDSMLGLKELEEAVLKAEGADNARADGVPLYANPYIGENLLSSVNKAEQDDFNERLFKPLLNEVARLAPTAEERGDLVDYMFAKHGLERNERMARRDARDAAEKKYGKELRAAARAAAAYRKKCEEAAANGGLTDEARGKLAAAEKRAADLEKIKDAFEEAEYQSNRMKDYAGLTALTEEPETADAERAAAAMVRAYEDTRDTAELWARVKAVTGATLTKLRDCGLISRSAWETYRGMYDYYIPLQGFDETTSAEEYAYENDHLRGGGPAIRRAKGRRSKADDPFANMAAAADGAIVRGNRNRLVKQRLYNFALLHPSDLLSVDEVWLAYNEVSGEWEEVSPGGMEGTEVLKEDDTAEEVAKKMSAFRAAAEKRAKETPATFKRKSDMKDVPYKVVSPAEMRQHQVKVLLDGDEVTLTVNGNPRAAQAVNGQTSPTLNEHAWFKGILNFGESVNRYLSAVYTTLNVNFTPSNFWRDFIYTMTNVGLKEKDAPGYAGLFRENLSRVLAGETVSDFVGKKKRVAEIFTLYRKLRNGTLDMSVPTERMFAEFLANGGETGYANVRDTEAYKDALRREFRKANADWRSKEGLRGKRAAAWDYVKELTDRMNRPVENAARFAAYMTSREMGRSVERSAYDAKEISVNFNKKGSGARFYGATGQTWLGNLAAMSGGLGRVLFVFWNAAVQGSYNFLKYGARDKKKFARNIGVLFALGAAQAAWNTLWPYLLGGDDDDDYYNLPDNVRRQNLLLGLRGTWASLPLSAEYRAPFGLGELAGSLIFGGERMEGGEIAMRTAEQLSQLMPVDLLEGGGGWRPFVPSAVAPLADALTNTSWTGLPIAKREKWNENLPEYKRVYKRTNGALVSLSEALSSATGGDAWTRGGIEINPATAEYLLNGYLGGFATLANQMIKTGGMAYDMAAEGGDFDPSAVPVLNRLLKRGNDRTSGRAANAKVMALRDNWRSVVFRMQHYREDTYTGAHDYTGAMRKLTASEEFRLAVLYDEWRGEIESREDLLKAPDLTEAERERVEKELRAAKRALAEASEK